jgi:uncharacterized protein YjbI with pentapeptide repeats
MPNPDHLSILDQGVEAWNAWRKENPSVKPDLSRASFYQKRLDGADFREANLTEASLDYLDDADLSGADLRRANLIGARLRRAKLIQASLFETSLIAADCAFADFSEADLSLAVLGRAKLEGARFRGACLELTNLVEADLTDADLTGCYVYGTSVWAVKVSKDTKQQNLIITERSESKPEITVDNIEVAQFLHLLLHNAKIRSVIDTITTKVVLILGRFIGERKVVLDALREELRRRNYLPILFDFERPASRTTDETITLLARMARFVIADISDAKSVLQELRAIVPELTSVPVQPIIVATQEEPGMFDFYRNRLSVLPGHRYYTLEHLIADLSERVIGPAETKVFELHQEIAPRQREGSSPPVLERR